MRHEELTIERRNAMLEAFRSGKTIDKLFVLDGCQDEPVRVIVREVKKHDTIVNYVTKERLDQTSEVGEHQDVIASAAAYEYAKVEDVLKAAGEKGEPPFLILLGGVEDPHSLGATIRAANLTGAHRVIIPRRRAVGLTATVVRTSARALDYTLVVKITSPTTAMKDLKKKGMWFACTGMGGEVTYKVNLKGPIGLVIGNEGEDVGKLVSEHCGMTASMSTEGDIGSLDASMAASVLAYEIIRQRTVA